ncbi:C2 family cysteine protease [Ottowia flava]|uniref:C2 family cysteine protease n=1 Tax=Ottowia flava TaxID=2675430 RepID=A0ABW4KW22_9BURK|nr:C2 family cysteine protease [Ottowia sp. GY511]
MTAIAPARTLPTIDQGTHQRADAGKGGVEIGWRVDQHGSQLLQRLGGPASGQEGRPTIPPSDPTPVDQRRYDASDLYGATGKPSAADIQQDRLGDCFFIATAGAVANESPERIQDAISYNEETGNFSVKLYDGKDWVDVEVTQAEIQDNIDRGGGSRLDNGDADAPIWPAVMETAYAKLRGGTLDKGYEELNKGGKARDAMETLTGSRGDDISSGMVSLLGEKFVENQIRQALEDGRPVTLSTDPEKTCNWLQGVLGCQDAPQDGLADNHVYVVESIYTNDSGDVMVRLRNPWQQNSAGSVGEDTAANSDSAFIEVKLSDIVRDGGFEYFNIGPQ